MKRTSIKRKTPLRARSFLKPSLRAKVGKTVSIWKKARPKSTPIRASARNEDCTLRFHGICQNRTDTTVWCHSNSSQDGKGMALKARDEEGCYGCFECHSFLDGGWVYRAGWTREMVDQVFDRARWESRAILARKGLLGVTNA